MIPKYAPADLGPPSIASQSGMVKHTKFDHVLDTIFCAFWTESVHCAFSFVLGYPDQKHSPNIIF